VIIDHVHNQISDELPMLDNMTEIIEKLKKGAIDRCRERVIEARKKPKNDNTSVNSVKNSYQNHGLTSHMKKMRGL
jgi:hypothetical protein